MKPQTIFNRQFSIVNLLVLCALGVLLASGCGFEAKKTATFETGEMTVTTTTVGGGFSGESTDMNIQIVSDPNGQCTLIYTTTTQKEEAVSHEPAESIEAAGEAVDKVVDPININDLINPD